MSLVSVNLEDLAEVVRLACLTESRDNAEQRALLKVARRVDSTWNTVIVTNHKTWERVGEGWRLLRPLSHLEAKVHGTRDVDPDAGEKVVILPDKGRWKQDPTMVVVE